MKKIIFFILLAPFALFSQTVNTWRNYTNMENVKDICELNGTLWGATDGGVFSYNLTDGAFVTYNKAEGLTDFDATAIACDNLKRIWIGFSNGVINVLDPKSGSVRAILDIQNSDKSELNINDIYVQGDTILVSTDFGLSLIDAQTFLFIDTYTQFGSWAVDTKINSAFKYNGMLYVASGYGIAKQKEDARNLISPDSWQIYQTAEGLPSNTVNKFTAYQGSLLAATAQGISVFQNNSWSPYLTDIYGRNTGDLYVKNDTLLIIANTEIYLYNGQSLTYKTAMSAQAFNIISASQIIAASTGKGVLLYYPNGEAIFVYPEGPGGNTIPDMEVDQDGNLWCASGNPTGNGLYKFDGSSWHIYNKDNSNLPSNNVFRVNVSPNNQIYASMWDRGFAFLKDGKFITINDTTYPELIANDPSTHYMVAGDVAFDGEGNTWFLNSESQGNKILAKLSPDSALTQYVNLKNSSSGVKAIFLLIDDNNTKWFSTPTTGNVYYYNEDITLPGSSGGWGAINLGTDATTAFFIPIVKDKRGEIWIGKRPGISVISNSLAPTSVSIVYSMYEETVNCIAVDAINQKWVGTNEGVYLLSPDGATILAIYNMDNSPLLNNEISSIALDKKKGIVYIGTDYGVTSLASEYIQPVDSFGDITVYPNPYVISESGNGQATIDGLVKDSQLKIFSLTGKLIAEFSSPGGRIAFWDGRNTSGNLVGSGIYIITAYDTEGNNIASSKIAVIRK